MTNLILTNGKSYTFDPTHPSADTIAFDHGRVVAFDDEALALRTTQTQMIDLHGRTVIPGLTDHHIHFTAYAAGLARVNLDGARSLEEAVARVAERVKTTKPGEWIYGLGWNHTDWAVPVSPTKAPLDAIAPNNPIALDRKDGHSVWVNSAALRMANITRDTLDPAGGRIERDANGEPAGVLRENAIELLGGNIGFEAGNLSQAELRHAIQIAHTLGLTGIHNVEGADALRWFQRLRAQNLLSLRVTHMIPTGNLDHAIALGVQAGFGDEWLRIGGVKIFADGSLGSQTAWMLEPFAGQRDNVGIATTPPAEIERIARAAAQAGLWVCIHAIGDRANRTVLDIYEKLRSEGLSTPLRIEHAQHLHPADIARFRQLNVIASMQPIHATSDYRIADQFIGARGQHSYAFRSLLDAGARLAFGSDCPVETLDPLVGIHAAVTRERADGSPPGGWYPQEKLSVEQAVSAYIGSPLSPEHVGDAVVLSQDIFAIPPREILHTHVEHTIVGGEVVFSAE